MDNVVAFPRQIRASDVFPEPPLVAWPTMEADPVLDCLIRDCQELLDCWDEQKCLELVNRIQARDNCR